MAPVTTHPGACPLDCPDTCVWQLTVDDGRAVALRGDRDHPFTRGALCGKVNRYLDAVNGPDRLTTPWVRTGPKGTGRVAYRPASWDEALDRVAAGLRTSIERDGPESVLPYYFAGTMGLVQGWTMGPGSSPTWARPGWTPPSARRRRGRRCARSTAPRSASNRSRSSRRT
ncbi:hypothetical protein [Micromonospora aurantiaca (nom. illeg.)]|uniref:hypothetical protein n=1 Tax=Micromonospora aurantiaca (nom. illeg.) TaxID=47850 RepID=UPI003EC08750